jgi:hypothetical protein
MERDRTERGARPAAAELVEVLSTRQMPLEREEQTTGAVREVEVPRY